MTITTSDILKVVIDYVYPGAGTALNVFYYVYAGADEDDQDVVDAIVDWADNGWGNNWDNLASGAATLRAVTIQVVSGLGEILRDLGTTQINRPGQVTGEVLPAANSCYLQAYTDVPQVYGRKYAPGIGEEAVENGVFSAVAQANIALLLLEYLDTINVAVGNNLFPGVLSKREAGFKAFNNSGLFRTLPAYQRRRKEGVGI